MSEEGTPVSSEGQPQDELVSPDIFVSPDEAVWSEPDPAIGADGELTVTEMPKPSDSFWQRLKHFVFGSTEGTEQRLRGLSLAIEMHPDTPANYVLRGEIYLEIREYELAAADFQRALELAAAQFETSDWGGIAQVMRDRAEMGLEKTKNR